MSSMRLDKYVASKFPEFSRTQAQRAIEQGRILVNMRPAKPKYLVKDSDRISVKKNVKKVVSNPSKPVINLPVLYQDKDCMVINKPAGMSVYPINSEDKSLSILDFVLFKIKSRFVDKSRSGIVHRLDKDTSGVLILAKNQRALEQLMAQFKGRMVEKFYLALVFGVLQHPEGIIDAPIGRSTGNRKKMSLVNEKEGRNAISHYKTLDVFRIDAQHIVSLVRVQIMTGRTHQIRVHMSSIGHPVIGDSTYGNQGLNKYFLKKFGLKRQFLHANTIKFKSPSSGKEVKVEAKLPSDLKDLESRLRQL